MASLLSSKKENAMTNQAFVEEMQKKQVLKTLKNVVEIIGTNIVPFLYILKRGGKMRLVEQLNNDMIEAMKSKDKNRLTVIRMVKAAMQQENIDRKKEINSELVIDVVNKQIKMRNDSILEFEKANRTDLVEKTKEEIEILKVYLPEPLTEEEVDEIIASAVSEVNPTNMRDMGKLMTIVTPQVKGKFDLSIVSAKIKEVLSQI